MIFSEPIPGLFHLKAEPHRDERGSFSKIFTHSDFQQHGLCTHFVEWALSDNTKAHTLRGLHWQHPMEIKLVQCVRGAIFDVAVDLRADSPTFGKHYSATLSAENGDSLYIAKGFAHGFQTLEDDSTVLYHISEPYAPEGARGVRPDDPSLTIQWPNLSAAILSKRDAGLPFLSEIDFSEGRTGV